jgi:hypothetical protein
MVAISNLLPVALACTVANANFFIDQGSLQIVKALTNARSANVPAAKASAEANHFVTGILSYPAFQRIIYEADQPSRPGDNRNMKQVVASFVNEASVAYDQFSHGPSFSPYTSYFKEHISDFDVTKFYISVTNTLKQYYPLVAAPLSSFFNDPQGRAVGKTAQNIARHFLTDNGLGQYASVIPDRLPLPPLPGEQPAAPNEPAGPIISANPMASAPPPFAPAPSREE